MVGPATGKARPPTVDSFTDGTSRRLARDERRKRRPGKLPPPLGVEPANLGREFYVLVVTIISRSLACQIDLKYFIILENAITIRL